MCSRMWTGGPGAARPDGKARDAWAFALSGDSGRPVSGHSPRRHDFSGPGGCNVPGAGELSQYGRGGGVFAAALSATTRQGHFPCCASFEQGRMFGTATMDLRRRTGGLMESRGMVGPDIVPRTTLVHQLRSVGVEAGGVFLVHTSFRALRPVEHGPGGLIAALFEAVGDGGTLVMPAWSGCARSGWPGAPPRRESRCRHHDPSRGAPRRRAVPIHQESDGSGERNPEAPRIRRERSLLHALHVGRRLASRSGAPGGRCRGPRARSADPVTGDRRLCRAPTPP